MLHRLTFLLLCLLLPARSFGLIIPIRSDWARPTAESAYTRWLNLAPPIYIWQNDPAVIATEGEARPGAGYTNLCVPSIIGTALIDQKLFQKSAPGLAVPGVDLAARQIDTAATLRELAHRCGSDVTNKTTKEPAFRCISDFYHESGYRNPTIRLIANQDFGYSIPNYTLDKRLPTINDVIQGLSEGYEVIAISERISNGRKVGSHWFNVWGYLQSSGSSAITLYATDSNRRYNKLSSDNAIDGMRALYTPVTATPMVSDAGIVPPEYAPIRLKGLLIDQLGPDIVLGAVLLLKAGPK